MKACIVETKENQRHNRRVDLVNKHIGKVIEAIITPDEPVDGWVCWKLVGVRLESGQIVYNHR